MRREKTILIQKTKGYIKDKKKLIKTKGYAEISSYPIILLSPRELNFVFQKMLYVTKSSMATTKESKRNENGYSLRNKNIIYFARQGF
jgi:hypothetical protein